MSEVLVVTTRNSVYEVDFANQLVRRVVGTVEPTQNFHSDGLWHPFDEVVGAEVGDGMRIYFPNGRSTVTSPVTKVTRR